VTCDFSDINREIKTQIIHNCVSQQLRKKALREEMSLDDLLAAARSLEIADKHAEQMAGKQNEINHVNKSKLKCFKCGGNFPHKERCPAIGKKCKKCGAMNHFAVACRKIDVDNGKPSEKSVQQLDALLNSSDEEYMCGV